MYIDLGKGGKDVDVDVLFRIVQISKARMCFFFCCLCKVNRSVYLFYFLVGRSDDFSAPVMMILMLTLYLCRV